jgi:restriction endonuclease S subunit
VKILIKDNKALLREQRWDIDYHLPAELILDFPEYRRTTVSKLADVSNVTRNPADEADSPFLYVDISSINIHSGTIDSYQELIGEEAPSRARMVIRAYDVLVSTVRPTRRAIAVVPPELNNQICSTGYCVLRCKPNVDPYFLQFILRSPSTLEQFRKFSTGSSYPAILSTDVMKTIVPNANPLEQKEIAGMMMDAIAETKKLMLQARECFREAEETSIKLLRM